MKMVLCLALVITSLFMFPVSAEESVFIGDYGVGFARDRNYNINLTTGTLIRSFPYTTSAERSAYYFFQFDWKPNYTYRVICSFDFISASTNFRTDYDIFKSTGYNITGEYPNYFTVSWNDVEILRNNDDVSTPDINYSFPNWTGNYLEVEIIFDNDVVQLESLDYMIMRSIRSYTASADVYQMNYQVEAYEDPNNDIYNELILNQLNTISGQLNDILNTGSDHTESIPTNGDELSDAVTDLDNAEKDLYHKSDNLIENVQSQIDESKNQAVAALPNLTTSALAVTNVYNMIKSTIPDEVKILFVVVPVILFFAYLIGRKD